MSAQTRACFAAKVPAGVSDGSVAPSMLVARRPEASPHGRNRAPRSMERINGGRPIQANCYICTTFLASRRKAPAGTALGPQELPRCAGSSMTLRSFKPRDLDGLWREGAAFSASSPPTSYCVGSRARQRSTSWDSAAATTPDAGSLSLADPAGRLRFLGSEGTWVRAEAAVHSRRALAERANERRQP